MHSLDGFGLPSGETCRYSRPSNHDSFLARVMVPGLRPVTDIKTFSVTQSLGTSIITFDTSTSHHLQFTAVAPHLKHASYNLTAVKVLRASSQVIEVAVASAHPYFEFFVHYSLHNLYIESDSNNDSG